MSMLSICLAASLLVSASPDAAGTNPLVNPVLSKAKEREELIAKLKRNIFKVDRSIGETEKLIAKSRNAPYLPDLQFRLAELYVEKSRYVYHLQAETRPPGTQGALVSPETRLLKSKAVQIYDRILREFPNFKDGDKVQFYLAHEQRELGQFDEMIKSLQELTTKWPHSPLRLDSEQILGDHYFEKSDLAEAEKHYQAILQAPPSPVHDLARYKMGWIRVNQSNHAEAVNYFEAAAASPPIRGTDPKKALNIKREALLDLVYSYTEVKPAKGALQYFERLSDSQATFALALEKLGNRYFIKQQFENAIPALRRLMEVQIDPELDKDRAEKIYDSLKAAKGKVNPKPVDVRMLVRAAVEDKTNPDLDAQTRQKSLAQLEEMARDLATQMHLAAQKRDDRPSYLEAAEGYAEYLSLFRPAAFVRTMMRNRADALFAAKAYPEAARQFEELARLEDGKSPQGYQSALYGALLSHFSALKQGTVENLTAFEVADARQALKLLGAQYVSRFPRSDHVTEVKFNIARAYYDDGEFQKSAELFSDFALKNPDYKDAPVAGHLALDSYRQLNDFKGLETTGRRFLASRMPGPFLSEVRGILAQTKATALDELALKSSEETGDVLSGLKKVADENKGQEIGEKALYGAFVAAREKRDLPSQRELANRLVTEYPKSNYRSDVLLSLGRTCVESARFEEAATWFEEAGAKLGSDVAGLDGWLSAAKLRAAMHQYREAIRDLELASEGPGGRKSEVFVLLAGFQLKNEAPDLARAAVERALRLNRQDAAAVALLAQLEDGSVSPNAEKIAPAIGELTKGPGAQSEDGAKALWYFGDILYKSYKAVPADNLEKKGAELQQLEAVFTQAASAGSAEWAVASLWRLGSAYQHLADVVDGTATPQGLSASDAEKFRTVVKKQVAPLRKRAESAFDLCLSKASSLQVFSPAVLGCAARSERAQLPAVALGAGHGDVNTVELQKKAEETVTAQAMEALGLAQLSAGQLAMAQLSLGRATELEDGRALSHNALGLVLLAQGDPMGARGEYAKALEADPTYEKARANLAALHCRFGDKNGARRELTVVKQAQLAGPDLDPEWRACR